MHSSRARDDMTVLNSVLLDIVYTALDICKCATYTVHFVGGRVPAAGMVGSGRPTRENDQSLSISVQ